MPDGVHVTPTADGPYMVVGEFALQWPSGHVISQAGEADEKDTSISVAAVTRTTSRFATTRISGSASSQPKEMPRPIRISASTWGRRM